MNKCSECGMPLNIPFVVFKCGHGYHNLCLGVNLNINDIINCRKCKDKRNKNNEEIKFNKNYYNSVFNHDKLEKELAKNKDKIDFLHGLYSKGLFDLGPIKDNIFDKEKE